MATRDELVEALSRRYGMSGRAEKTRILDEFVAVTGFHRKHAMRLLRGGPTANSVPASRPGRRLYDDAVREALVVLWEASDRICGKRLKPLLPTLVEAMERHGHLDLAEDVRCGLLSMSAATIDRALRGVREQAGGRRRKPAATSSVRRSIPVRTHSDWQDPPPGFVEADLVAHSGPVTRGSFVQTLVLTDIATGCAAGSKPNHGGPAASCSSGCRRSIRAAIPTSSCARYSAGSRSGAVRGFTTWCSARTVPDP